MQAVVMTGHGGRGMLKLFEVEAPRVSAPHDVLVRVLACGVNRADVQARGRPFGGDAGGLTSGELIPGLEGTGVVEEVGGAVTRFSPGAEVYYADGGFGSRHGSYAQYKVVDERYLARKPASLDFPSAASAPVVLITAWEALFERARVKTGDFVLVHGGAGGVGHIGVQLAAGRGARVAATVSTDIKAGLAGSLGAERVIRYREENVLSALREWTGKDGADVVFDTVGGHNFAASFELVAPYGTLVNIVVSDWPRGANGTAGFRNIRVAFENMGLPQAAADHDARVRQTRLLEDAAKLFDAGRLRVELDRVYPLAEAGAALRALEGGEITGRVALEIP